MEITYRTYSAAQTRTLGKKMAQICRGGEVFLLSGDLGAGKTCLTQGIAHGLGITTVVTSPTFVTQIEHRAPNGLRLQHFDFYRLDGAGGENFGDFVDWFNRDGNICVIEWAEKLSAILPPENLQIAIETVGEKSRVIKITATTAKGKLWLECLQGTKNGV